LAPAVAEADGGADGSVQVNSTARSADALPGNDAASIANVMSTAPTKHFADLPARL
jgi:hypothetical protein